MQINQLIANKTMSYRCFYSRALITRYGLPYEALIKRAPSIVLFKITTLSARPKQNTGRKRLEKRAKATWAKRKYRPAIFKFIRALEKEETALLFLVLPWFHVRELNYKEKKAAAAKKPHWQSFNYAVTRARGFLTTSEVAEILKVSPQWVRRHIPYTEWHHSYKYFGKYGKAFLYDPLALQNLFLRNKHLCRRLLHLNYLTYYRLGREIYGPAWDEDLEKLAWLQEIGEHAKGHAKG